MGFPGKRPKYCKFCHAGPFVWKRTVKGWRMSSSDGTIHECRQGRHETPGAHAPEHPKEGGMENRILEWGVANGMSVDDLRKHAREHFGDVGGRQIAFMKKAELVDLVTGTEQNLHILKMEDMEEETIPVTPSKPAGNSEDAGKALAALIIPHLPTMEIDAETVKGMVETAVEAAMEHQSPREFVIKNENGDTIRTVTGKTHKLFGDALMSATIREDTLLVGPAGSGKNTMVEQIAEALGLRYFVVPVGLHTSQAQLLGYMNAAGVYVRTLLREAYENGGVLLIDEVDAGNPSVLTIVNGLLANGIASFPDGMVKRHKDFICFAAGNTYGRGADMQYVGRNQLDAATLDRFVTMAMDYDEGLEREIATNADWCARVQKIRSAVFAARERVIVSPRATIKGCKLIAAGFERDKVEEMLIWRGVNPEIRSRILASL